MDPINGLIELKSSEIRLLIVVALKQINNTANINKLTKFHPSARLDLCVNLLLR